MGLRLSTEGFHVDHKSVLDVGPLQSLPGFVDLLHRDHFYVGRDVVCAAEVEHLLGLRDAADVRSRHTAIAEDQRERRQR